RLRASSLPAGDARHAGIRAPAAAAAPVTPFDRRCIPQLPDAAVALGTWGLARVSSLQNWRRCYIVRSMSSPIDIAPARGKLGVLLVGLGAVSTTTIAGVIAVRNGFARPIGSLTQMGTVRLGKRTENRSPKISDVVPLSSLDDLVFGGWDIFE